jgi:hypothetical protein
MSKKITSYSLGPEAQGKTEYPSVYDASYITYPCAYCTEPFYIVDPDTHDAGGAFQQEFIRHKDIGEVIGIRRTNAVCLSCIRYMLQRQQSERS